jgi:predicted phage tail protein
MAGGSSKQYIGLVDLLCEGPIHGLVNGKNSVYINDVPFENSGLVGTFNQEQTSAFKQPTLSYTANATSINVSGVTLTDKDIGKFAHIEVESITGCNLTRSSISLSNVGGGNETYLSLSGTGIDSDFNTLTDNLSYVKVKSSNGVSFYADAKYTSGTTVTLYVSSRNISNQLISSTGWTITLIKAVEVTGRTDSDTFTIDSAFHTSNLTDVDFFFSDAPAIESTTTGLVNNISKFDGSTLQFRKGTLFQAPIQQVNSLSGGVTITGAGNARSLQQSTDASSTYGLTLYNTSGYPENQSFPTDVGNAALVIPSGSPSGGIGFGLSSSQAQQVSELNVRINYSALITHNNESGDKSSASAIYVFLLELKKPGESNWNDHITLFSNHGGEVVHTDQTTAPVAFDHIIGLDRFKPFDDFRITIVRLTRDSGGLPVRANGGTGGETDRGKFTVQAQSSIAGANLSATIKDKFSYPYTAHAAVSFSSKTYDSLPSRSYLLQGLKVQIPTSYTPREYTDDGVAVYEDYWNGEFKSEQLDNDTSVPLLYYTDNPAWVFYDIVTNNRYGAGEWIEPGFINKFALYRIAKYCDELVDDGNGGTEPRFRANLYLAKATEVYKVLKDMATIFTGMLYWLDGKLTAVQDVPSEPVYNFSKANVVDGVFNYESTGRKTRVNQVVVTWNDPSANYEPVPLIVEDREAIVKAGRIISQNSVAMGATSEGQALRYGRWKLWTAQNQKEVVSFKTGLQGAFIRPGDIINVQDRDRYGVDYSGLTSSTTSATASSVTLDRKLSSVASASKHKFSTIVDDYATFYTGLNPVTIDGKTYSKGDRITGRVYIYDTELEAYYLTYIGNEREASNAFQNSTGTPLQTEWKPYTYVVTKAVTLDNTGDVSVVTIDTSDTSLPEIERTNYSGDAPAAGTLWVLQALDANDQNILGSKKEYRVLSIAQEDNKNTYSITAVEYYVEKYDAVDKDYALGVTPSNVFPTIEDPDEEVPTPDNIYVAIDSDSSKPGEEIIVTWGTPQETFLDILDTVQNRTYSFLDKYELYHDVPHVESPIVTSRLSYRFENLEDGLYTFRVRAVSRKQNYSDFVSTQYEVNDIYGSAVPRIVGGLPKGIVANSQISYAYDANASSNQGGTEAVRFTEGSSATGFSIGNLLVGDNSPSASLSNINVSGLVDKVAQEWYYLLFDGGSGNLLYWDTDTLETLPFYKKIQGGTWRGSATSSISTYGWSSKTGGYTLAADSTRITFNSSNSSLKIGDIIAFEDINEVEAVSINSVTSTSGSYRIEILTNFDNYLIANGDKVKLENATFTGSGTDFNNKEYYAKRISTTVIELYKDEALSENVTSSDIGKTWDEGGWIRRIGVKGAKVIAKVSNTEAILDRSFSSALTSSNAYYVRNFQPDFKDDAVFGRVRWNSTNEQTLVNSFSVDSFIQLDPSLTSGKAVLVTPSLETIRYETNDDGTTVTQTSEFESLTATVTGLGFIKPQFRLVSYQVNGNDTTVLNETISTNFAEPDEVGGFSKEFTINNDNDVDYGTGADAGAPIIIKAEVREANNVGINAFGSGDILRVKDGAAGTQGRTVELTAEDYTIVYDTEGENPSFEDTSGTSASITITSTSRNFGDNPLFRITIDSNNAPTTSFSSWVDGTSGTDNSIYSTYIIPPTVKPNYSSKVIQVQVAERPENWNAATQQGQDSEGNAITPTVGASDSISILYLQQGEGGIAIANSNSAHAYATNSNGEFTGSTITGSGTTIEVLIGGTRGTYRGTSNGTLSSGGFSGTLDPGDWYIVSAVSSTSEFSAGNITASGNIATIGAVNVDNTIGYGEDVEQITWTIRVGTRSGTTIDLTTIQSLSKSRRGTDSTVIELTNDAETVGGTENQALSGLSLSTTAQIFAGVADVSSSWDFTATAATGITVNSTGTGTDGNIFTVTALSSSFTSGNVVITAVAKSTGDYAGSANKTANFTITKVNNGQDGVSYRITTSNSAVVYDPNADPVSWSPTSVTFSASKITPDGATSFTSGYWKLNNSNQGQASSVSSGTISFTSGNITAQLYLDSSYTQLVDTESVPIISKGLDADALTVTEDTSVAGQITLNFSDGTSITINDGDDGDTKGVVPIYASNSSGDNQSYTQGSLAYVNYYEYTNSKPTLPVSNLTWVKYIGEDGDSQGVIPIYADNASGTNATFTYSNQEYVNFYEWTGSAPTVVPAGLTYVKFVGDDGDDGTSVTVTSTSTSNGVTTVNFSDGTSITITDGDDGTSEGVLVVYADDSSGTNKSTTRGANQNYVLYYEWTGTKPSVSSVTGTWVLFVGDDGETQGVIPVYSSVASPTSTGQLSLTYSNQEYITFFEYTGTKPTSVTSAMVSQTYVPFVGDDGADGTAGDPGDPGPRSVFAYIYYQSSSTSAPTIPALSTFTPNFTNGSVSSSNSNWSTNTPTFVAGNTNKYWYFTFTATESGTYNNGYPSVTKNSSPSAGSGAIQGIGFTGLVTFSSTNNIDGFNPIEWINDNGATTGTSNTTTIDGGLIRTNTIIANKLAFTPVTSVAGVSGSSISTAQLSSAGLSLTQDLGSLASQDTVDLVNDISGNLPTTSGGTGNSYSNLTALANGIAATTAFGDLASLDSISATSSYITGLGDLATQNEANLDFIGLSSTVIQAGKITLGTSGVLFDNADSSHTVVQNAIILDTSGSANAIYIYDGNALRVKLGKL